MEIWSGGFGLLALARSLTLFSVSFVLRLMAALASGFPLRFALLFLIVIEGIIPYPLFGIRRRPVLPGRCQPSTFGAKRLNFCVRYGYRWNPLAIVTGIESVCSRALVSAIASDSHLLHTFKTAQ